MSKKRGRNIRINITLSNRWLYTLILIGILVAVGVGVYAATYTASGAGHPYTELSTCGANQTLVMNVAGTAWECGDAGITQEYAELNYKDPPGQWTCTLRTQGSTSSSSTVSCVSPEKVISGGCSCGDTLVAADHPGSPNTWVCVCDSSLDDATAYAYCCL